MAISSAFLSLSKQPATNENQIEIEIEIGKQIKRCNLWTLLYFYMYTYIYVCLYVCQDEKLQFSTILLNIHTFYCCT